MSMTSDLSQKKVTKQDIKHQKERTTSWFSSKYSKQKTEEHESQMTIYEKIALGEVDYASWRKRKDMRDERRE